MSYDVEVYGKRSLRPRDLVSVITEDAALHADVTAEPAGISAVVRAQGGSHCFLVDGPSRRDREEMPEGRADLAGRRVHYSISVAYDEEVEANTALALAFAARLAARVDGVVVDAQTEDPPPPAARPAEPELFLHLEWFRVIDEHSADFAAHYVAAAEELFPRALPRAFGHWSPTLKFAKEGAAGSDRFYREECATDRMRIAGRKPLEYGYLEEWSHQQIGERQRLGLVLDATTLVKPRPAAAVEAFFVDLAARCGSFYACADVRPSRYQPPVAGAKWGEWTGLPVEAPWLSWFAPDYAELVRPHLVDGELRESANGLLHISRTSPAPEPSEDRDSWLPEDFVPLLGDPDDRRLATATARVMPERLRSSNRLVRTR